jgi:DNA-binding transcriptional MerR regulator
MTPKDEIAAAEAIEAPFRIGELARRVGATPRTVRYYEELGLLPDRGRPEGAHRLYDLDV